MKNLLYLFATVLFVVSALSSCQPKGAEVEYLPCAVDSASSGMVGADGSVMDLAMSGQVLSPVVNGFFTASTPEGVTVYRLEDGVAHVVEGLSGLRGAGFMAYGVMPVCRHGKHIELVNDKGATVASIEMAEGEVTECDPCFRDGLLRITTDKGGQGLVNTKGEMVVEPNYAAIGPISDGLMLALSEHEKDGAVMQSYSVVGTSGNSRPVEMSVVPVGMAITKGRFVGRVNEGFVIVDAATGGIVDSLPADVTGVDEVSDGVIVCGNGRTSKSLWSILDGRKLTGDFRQVRIGPNGTVAVSDGVKWSVVDLETGIKRDVAGVTLLSPVAPEARAAGFEYVGATSSGYFIMNRNGEKLNKQPLYGIDRPLLNSYKITTGYATSTAPVELPEEDLEGV